MYIFQSRSSDMSFARMTSFFLKSCNRLSAFDSGNTHCMKSMQSLSIIEAGAFLFFWGACCALKSSLTRRWDLACNCDAVFLASSTRYSFCALKAAIAFPICVPQFFHRPDAEMPPSLLGASLSDRPHLRLVPFVLPVESCHRKFPHSDHTWHCWHGLHQKPGDLQVSYLSVADQMHVKTFFFFTQFLVKGQNPTFDHKFRIFTVVKCLVKGFMQMLSILLPSTIVAKSSKPIDSVGSVAAHWVPPAPAGGSSRVVVSASLWSPPPSP